MRVPLSWLRELAPTDLEPEDLAQVLTSKGAKVEGIHRPWEGLSGVVVARVLEVRDHPGSDRLCVVRVDAGPGHGELEVVAGVRNMAPGDLVPLAPPGARVPALAEPLGRRELRGVVSNGMICSPHELAISPDHSGILILPPDGALAVGQDVRVALGLDDVVFDIEVKSNRPDLLSIAGVAREVAAATGVPLTLPDASVAEGSERAEDVVTVRIDDLERCPRYLARVIRDVSAGPSPLGAQARLTACGMRPISNVVDATNYVLLELGQPLHPFDLSLVAGPGIVVRRSAEGEELMTLDGVTRRFVADDLLIADLERAVAIAGVMGGGASEVSEATSEVLLESAYFERTGVARASRRQGLSTEASVRFERGTDPEGIGPAAARASSLIAAWAGGTVLAGVAEAGATPPRRRLVVRPDRAALLLGTPVSAALIRDSLGRIGLATAEADSGVEAEIPGYRPDIEREVDLIEEVVRVTGYRSVGETLPLVRQAGGVPESYAVRRRVREAMVRSGIQETWSYSFASADDVALVPSGPPVRIANPLSAEEGLLRTSLLPGLLRALRTNLFRQARGAALFEVGRAFELADPAGEDGPVRERDLVAFAMTGVLRPGVHGDDRPVDFFNAKGALETLLAVLGIDGWTLGDPPDGLLHPGRSATVLAGDAVLGILGELDPRAAERLALEGRLALAELDATALAPLAARAGAYREVTRVPPARRDLAFAVDERVAAEAVRSGIVEAAGGLVELVVLFDVFSGPPLVAGRKSLGFSVDFRSPERTLTNVDVDTAVARIADRLASELGAELRAG